MQKAEFKVIIKRMIRPTQVILNIKNKYESDMHNLSKLKQLLYDNKKDEFNAVFSLYIKIRVVSYVIHIYIFYFLYIIN